MITELEELAIHVGETQTISSYILGQFFTPPVLTSSVHFYFHLQSTMWPHTLERCWTLGTYCILLSEDSAAIVVFC